MPTDYSGCIRLEALEPLLLVRAVWEGAATYKEEVHNTIGTKLQMAAVQCLYVVQCATISKNMARTEGVEYVVAIDGNLA